VVFDQPTALAGKVLSGLQWEFQNGQLTKYNAQSNLDSFKWLYENASGDRDRVADIAIGLNPRAELIGFFNDRVVHGTLSIGGNKGIGGTNETQFGHEETLRKPTLEVDGYTLVNNGKIQPRHRFSNINPPIFFYLVNAETELPLTDSSAGP